MYLLIKVVEIRFSLNWVYNETPFLNITTFRNREITTFQYQGNAKMPQERDCWKYKLYLSITDKIS